LKKYYFDFQQGLNDYRKSALTSWNDLHRKWRSNKKKAGSDALRPF